MEEGNLNKEEPLVSILIPAYNHEKYIDDLIDSLLAQTYRNLEIFIADDNSLDQTYEKILAREPEIKREYPKTYVWHNECNKGITANLNGMLRRCTGKYIKILASDDFFVIDAIRSLVTYMEENPNVGLVFGNGIMGDENTHFPVSIEEQSQMYYEKPINIEDNYLEKLYEGDFILAPGVLFSRKAYEEIGEFDEKLWAEDWDFYLRIAEKMKIAYINKIVVMYRILLTSASHSADVRNRIGMRKSEIEVLNKHKPYVEATLGERLLYERSNVAFKEAFDMRSNLFLSEVNFLMKKYKIKKTLCNKILYFSYKTILRNILFT